MRYSKAITVITFLLIFSLVCHSQKTHQYDSFDSFIENRMEQYHTPGTAVCIVKGDSIYWSNAYGWANLENEVPFTINTFMNVASLSKTFTATAIMQLWEKGLIKLNEDINNYLPIIVRNPNSPELPITIQQLLTHTSSIIDGSAYVKSYTCGDSKTSLKYWVTNNLISEGEYYNRSENFLPNEPGTTHYYSNICYGLLGYIVEEVSGSSFQTYCMDNIFNPLGMKNTAWFIGDIDIKKHANPYVYISSDNKEDIANNFSQLFPGETEFQLNKQYAACIYSFPNYPDGGLRTSVNDLSHFLLAIMNGGVYKNAGILKESTIDKMFSLQIKGDNSQGLCWHKSEFESMWGHGGADPGVRTQMFFSTETKIGIIVFQNNNMGESFDLVKMLYREVK